VVVRQTAVTLDAETRRREQRLSNAAFACVVTPVLDCHVTFGKYAIDDVPGPLWLDSFGPTIVVDPIDETRSIACSAEKVSDPCVGPPDPSSRTLLARSVPRAALPCAARNAESATLGTGVKFVWTLARL
jgi:hypothetical protein